MLKKLWNSMEEYFLVSSLILTVGLIFIQVVMRYIFKNSLTWSEEAARYIFLWQIWVGASYAVKKNKHLRISILKDKLGEENGFYFELVSHLLWIVFTLFLVFYGYTLANNIFTRGQLSPAMRMPMGYAYLSVPVGCSMMLIRLIEKIIELVHSRKKAGAY